MPVTSICEIHISDVYLDFILLMTLNAKLISEPSPEISFVTKSTQCTNTAQEHKIRQKISLTSKCKTTDSYYLQYHTTVLMKISFYKRVNVMLEFLFCRWKKRVQSLQRWLSWHTTFYFLNRFQANTFGLYLSMLLL